MNTLKCAVDSTPTITSRGGEINILIGPNTVGSSHVVMGYSKLGVNERVAPHVHDFSEEAFFVIQGQGRIHFEHDAAIDFKPGDAVLVPKGQVHWIENTGQKVMEVVFSVAPLAPTPGEGHRHVNLLNQECVK